MLLFPAKPAIQAASTTSWFNCFGDTNPLFTWQFEVSLIVQGLKNGKAGKMGAHLLENWINITLLRPTKDPLQKGDLNSQAAPLRGLLDHGIHRNQLSKAGIGEESINRLYQGLYVYSIGLFDLLQVIAHYFTVSIIYGATIKPKEF